MMSSENELRLYCILRADLEIPVGKAIGQGGHAFVGALSKCSQETVDEYFASGAQPKIVLKGKNLNTIERAANECRNLGINCYVVTDAGRTVFPEPTVTCIGIGPVAYSSLPKFIQKLQLL